MGTVGKLEKKITVTKENERSLFWQYGETLNKFKPGDNIYRVIRFSNGNPYNTYTILMSRDEIVDCIKNGQDIIGLKLDKVGRLIEDPNAKMPHENKVINQIKNLLIKGGNAGLAGFDLTDNPEEYCDYHKLAIKTLGKDADKWDVHEFLLEVADEICEEYKFYSGAYFCSDEIENFRLSKRIDSIVEFLASEYLELLMCHDFDSEYILENIYDAHRGTIKLEPWIDFGKFNNKSVVDSAIALDEVSEEIDRAAYGMESIRVNALLKKALHEIHIKTFQKDPVDFELRYLRKNIEVFREYGFKANNPQETFKVYTKRAILNHGNSTQTIEDYIDLALAIQEIYYKNPENIRCDEEGVIIIDKAGIKIKRKPYILTVSRI